MTKEEAIKELKEMIKYEWETYQTKTARIYVNALEMAIETLEQEPKMGHWKDCAERDPWYRCSECEEKIWGSHYKYCPNCGAKMRK